MFVLWGHDTPSSGAFIGHFFRLGVLAQLSSNLGTSRLHEKEVGSQGAFGGIGVMLGPLAFLLSFACTIFGGHSNVCLIAAGTGEEAGAREDAREVAIQRATGARA